MVPRSIPQEMGGEGWGMDRLRPMMDTGARDAGPVEIPAREDGARSRQWGTQPQVQAGGGGTCSRDWGEIAGLRADMGEGAIGKEIKRGNMVGVPARGKAVTMGRHGKGPEGLLAEMKWRGGAGSSIQTRREY